MFDNRKLIAVVFASLVAGCAAKPYVCPILKLAAGACESVVIILPDGTQEVVPRSALVAMTYRSRAIRMEMERQGEADAGADR